MKKVVPKDAVLIPESAVRAFNGKIFDVYQWSQKMFDDSTETFEMLRRPDTVIVIAIVNNKVMVIEDTQPHTGARMGFPGGRVDEGEETLAAAKREVKEETGYEFEDWKLIEAIQPHSKLEWFVNYYVASNGKKTAEPKLDTGEKISLKFVSFDELRQMVLDKVGYLHNALEIFEKADSLDELQKFPEFIGKEVER